MRLYARPRLARIGLAFTCVKAKFECEIAARVCESEFDRRRCPRYLGVGLSVNLHSWTTRRWHDGSHILDPPRGQRSVRAVKPRASTCSKRPGKCSPSRDLTDGPRRR